MNKVAKYIMLISCIGILTAIDLISKSLFDGKILDFIPNFISIYGLSHNSGAAFSSFENSILLFIILAVLFLIFCLIYEYKTIKTKKHIVYYIGGVFLLAGTIGNMIDRVIFGYVRDFIKLEFMNFPIFNIADCALTIGVIFLAIYIFFFHNESKKVKVEEI